MLVTLASRTAHNVGSMYMSSKKTRRRRKKDELISIDVTDSITVFLFHTSLDGWKLFMHGLFNTSTTIVFSPLCSRTRANRRSAISCISARCQRWCQPSFSRSSSSLSVIGLATNYKRMNKRGQRKAENPVHSLNQIMTGYLSCLFLSLSLPCIRFDGLVSPIFYTVQLYRRGERERKREMRRRFTCTAKENKSTVVR